MGCRCLLQRSYISNLVSEAMRSLPSITNFEKKFTSPNLYLITLFPADLAFSLFYILSIKRVCVIVRNTLSISFG